MSERPWKDEYTLLCEKCGYVIEGLDTNGNCPECGKPITQSLPERRVGTPWQQSPGVGSLVRTWWMTLRHPLRTLDVMQFRERGYLSLLHYSLLSFAAASALLVSIETYSMDVLNWILSAVVLLIISCLFAFFLLCLTTIESIGLQFISRTKKTRITPMISWTIVAHGVVGWLITFLVWNVVWKAVWIYKLLNPAETELELRKQVGFTMDNILIPGFFIGLGVGLLAFETFAYLGLRRCKYANRVRPDTPQQGATTRVEDAQ